MIPSYIGLGSNQGEPRLQIAKAIESLSALKNSTLVDTSSRYLSKPYGPVEQADFINAVVLLETQMDAMALFRCLQQIETQMGRVRDGQKWGPRNIDLDLLLFGNELIDEKDLKVPHPEISKRNFVLYPLYELNNQLYIPGLGPIKKIKKSINTEGLVKLE